MVLLMAISVAARAGAGIDERLAQPWWQGLRVKADSLINFFQDRLLLVDPRTERGATLFHDYFDCVRVALSLPYSTHHLPLAPQGRTSPFDVTGSPISWEST